MATMPTPADKKPKKSKAAVRKDLPVDVKRVRAVKGRNNDEDMEKGGTLEFR